MRNVGFVVYPGFQMMGLAAATVFEIANLAHGTPVYDVRMVSENGGTVAGSGAIAIDSAKFGRGAFDTLIVCGGIQLPVASAGLIRWLRGNAGVTRRIASICTGAFVLGDAGLLIGKRATTHWFFAREMRARFPDVTIDEDRIFIVDGPIWTSAGMTAGIDLALAMVEEDLGRETAQSVARKLVVYHRRAGGQSQHSALLDLEPKTDRIRTALDFAKRNLKGELSVEAMAEAAHLSPRQFSRAFHSETGQSPAKAVEQLRIEAARLMLDDTLHPIDTVAEEAGFASAERMRRAFQRAYGLSPQEMRRRSRAA